MEAPNPDKPARAQTELDAALLHHELVVAALQSHARLARIEDEYQAKISAYWGEVEIHIQHGVALRTKRHAEEVCDLAAEVCKLEDTIASLTAQLARAKRKPALKAKKKRKASK